MIDLLYIVGTLAFFALMIAYVAGCDYIGRNADVERAPDTNSDRGAELR